MSTFRKTKSVTLDVRPSPEPSSGFDEVYRAEQPYPGQRGRDGAWQFLLVEVPPDVDRVVVSPMLIGTNVERPR